MSFLHVAFPAAYYRGAQGIILVYDVSRAETFDSLADIWLREVDMYGTVEESVKMVVANKTDLVCSWLMAVTKVVVVVVSLLFLLVVLV